MSRSRTVHPQPQGYHGVLKRVGDVSEMDPPAYQLPLDDRVSSSHTNSNVYNSSQVHVELGNHLTVNDNEHRPARNRRKKSYNEPSNNLVIREVQDENNDRLGVLEAARLKSEPYSQVSGQNNKKEGKGYAGNRMKSGVSEDPDLQEVVYGESTVHVSKVDRYHKDGKTRNSNRIKSSKNPNSNVFMMEMSISGEDRRLNSSHYKGTNKNQVQLVSHDSSSLILNEATVSDKTMEERKTKLTTTVGTGNLEEFDFRREKKCFVSCSNPQYALTFKNTGFMVNAKKSFGNFNSRYNISVREGQYDAEDSGCVGYLKGNFSGSEFNLFQTGKQTQKIIASIYYESACGCCSSNYRKLQVYFRLPAEGDSRDGRSLKEIYEEGGKSDVVRLVSKMPEWNAKHGVYILGLKGKSKVASRKNMVLIEESHPSAYVLMICKTADHKFHVQLGAPITPLVAMGVLLSSFDFKLCCQ